MSDRPAPLEYNRLWPMRLWLAGVFFFLYSPLITLIAFSFNDSKRNIVWRGFTLDYYKKLFNNDELMLAFANSLTIALVTTILSLVLGALAAIMLWRFRFPLKGVIEGTLSLPIVVPEIWMGVAMLLFFSRVVPWPPTCRGRWGAEDSGVGGGGSGVEVGVTAVGASGVVISAGFGITAIPPYGIFAVQTMP